MCVYHHLHFHHMEPCPKGLDFEVCYIYCANSTLAPRASSPLGQQQELVRLPCKDQTPAPESDPAASGFDFDDPCATGGCLRSQHCASGGCRLDELGGRWVCCRCEGGGNRFKWCVHPVRSVPDSLCYHVVCRGCRADAQV